MARLVVYLNDDEMKDVHATARNIGVPVSTAARIALARSGAIRHRSGATPALNVHGATPALSVHVPHPDDTWEDLAPGQD
jgi:hypothetical protein